MICGATLDEAIGAAVLGDRDRLLPPIRATVADHLGRVAAWIDGDPRLEWVRPSGGVVCFPRIRAEVEIDVDRFYDVLLDPPRHLRGAGPLVRRRPPPLPPRLRVADHRRPRRRSGRVVEGARRRSDVNGVAEGGPAGAAGGAGGRMSLGRTRPRGGGPDRRARAPHPDHDVRLARRDGRAPSSSSSARTSSGSAPSRSAARRTRSSPSPTRTPRAGVACHSSGNHGQALALAARIRGIEAHVVMPVNAAAVKRAAVAGYGARIIDCEPTEESRNATVARVVADTGAVEIHPFDDDRIIAGQGTAALELLADGPALDAIVAPVGGGGLLSGTAPRRRRVGHAGVRRRAGRGRRCPALVPHRSAAPQRPARHRGRRPADLPVAPHLGRHPRRGGRHRDGRGRCDHRRPCGCSGSGPSSSWSPARRCGPAAVLAGLVPGARIGVILSGGNVDLDRLPWATGTKTLIPRRVARRASSSLVVAVGCVSADHSVRVRDRTSTSSGPGQPAPGPLGEFRLTAWKDCEDDLECATLDVPLDWDEPEGETISLAVIRQARLRRGRADRVGGVQPRRTR